MCAEKASDPAPGQADCESFRLTDSKSAFFAPKSRVLCTKFTSEHFCVDVRGNGCEATQFFPVRAVALWGTTSWGDCWQGTFGKVKLDTFELKKSGSEDVEKDRFADSGDPERVT